MIPAVIGAAMAGAGTLAAIPPLLETTDQVFGTDILGKRKRLAEAAGAKAGIASLGGMDYFFEMQRQKDLRALIMAHQGVGRSVPGIGPLEESLSQNALVQGLEQKYASQLASMASQQQGTLTSAAELAARLGFEV